ncbi:tyrosine-protein phosphatase non-receptor type 14-like [Colossoma macropomum]|uniref:tyrosine-protein phosphatase non-receptor type 14-like n=1 Tax=Colossoma macropomum TaxID=42526 RepID=UPI001865142F|nr:tyrosine-protein phosphatase non-receptor type 14-like [Colossoma macropomum]
MPFGLKLRRTKRYNVLSKNYFVTRIRLLDNNVIECTLSVESTGQECLEAVAQRLELRETHYFGLWFHSKAQVPRWVELEKPLKKQLDKFGNEPLLFFGVMFYVPSVCRLEQEATRYQYYLQVKKEVLDGRLHCSVEQGIRLAGLAVQADFGDFTQYPSQDFLREYVLFPVNWPHVDEVLEDWTQKVAEEHKSHYRMQPAEAELLYIKEAEKLDGFGQESFAAKDNYTNDIFIGVSFIGVFVKHRNGRSIMLHRWKDIGTIGHNKSAITVEITSKDDTIMFHTEDMEMAKYIARLFTARHKFYKQNKICAEPTHSPVTIRRRPTWNRLPRPQSCILHSQYADHYQDTQSSQDSIFHDDPYYKSETSLVEFGFRNGPVPNGSMCSSPSVSSLNRSQTFIHSSPMSSNLSIPGSELMRPDYIPSHRHSAIIAPSYRPTPEYDAVMRQKRRLLPATPSSDCHSQSLRSLNISNTYAYRQPEALVYSQPEMRERGMYHGPYGGGGGPQPGYGPPTGPSPSHPGTGVIQPATGQPATAGNGISHTVSTPELANTKQQVVNGRTGDQSYAAHMLRNHLSRPPPPYPASFRPATSTPDLASSHRQRCMGGSSPELVTRKVQLSVKTFQPDSSAVVDLQSLQEVSEPLTSAKRRTALAKRHSMEVVGGMRAMEALVMKGANVVLPRRNTLREQAPSTATPPQPQAPPPPPPPPQPSQLSEVAVQMSSQKSEHQAQSSYQHHKTLSNVTMLIHSSESEEDEEEEETPELDVQIPGLNEDISAQLQAALANIPNKPPPEYPGPRSSGSSTALRHHNQDRSRGSPEAAQGQVHAEAQADGLRAGQNAAGGPQVSLSGATLGPSISEPDLTSVKERVRKEPVKERPVSEMFSIEDSIVEREIRQRTLERQKLSADSMKRPLMMAALNGLYVARMPVPENPHEDASAKANTDERCKHLELRLEEECLFTEYEQIPKKRAECNLTTAMMPENAERNRFRDVVPYEENRVELVPNKENNTGYINASHIKMMIRGEEWHYIATQGPLPNTSHDFWQMVWEQGVNVIAMVTAEEEGGRSKSHRYWPKLGSKHNSATHGKFKVTTKFRTDSGCYATTGLKVKHLLSGQERTVWHLQYTDWPEHGCPEYVQGFLSYLEEIQSVRRHTNSMLDTSKSPNPPVVVHCSAGVGRTGVVILTELMISCLEHNERVEVPVMLGRLRQQRMLMVQTVSQYKFVYQVLIQFLKSSRLI